MLYVVRRQASKKHSPGSIFIQRDSNLNRRISSSICYARGARELLQHWRRRLLPCQKRGEITGKFIAEKRSPGYHISRRLGTKKKKLLDCSNFPALKLYIATAAKSSLDGKTCLEKTMFSVSPLECKAMTLGAGEKGLFEPFPLFSALLLLLLVFSCKQGMHHHNPLEKEEEGNNNAKGRRTTEGFY